MGVNKRLRDLEDKVLGPIEPGSSKLHLFQPVVSEAEERFFQRVYQIMERYKGSDELPTPAERKLMEQAIFRIFKRAIDVFETVVQTWLSIDEDPDLKRIWVIRFWYFMMEVGRHIEQMRAENRIFKENKGWKKFDKAWAEYENTLTDLEKVPLWSDESFFLFMDEYVFRKPKLSIEDVRELAESAHKMKEAKLDRIVSKKG